MKRVVEICAEGVVAALAARAGRADRVELCENLGVGGVTPSAGAIAVACRGLDAPVHVLIRPNGRDFDYLGGELDAMRHDIDVARLLGASGIVIGMLRAGGEPGRLKVDTDRVARLARHAHPMSVTLHHAFDAVLDPFEALEALIEVGVDRVLTSGLSPTVREGMGLLAELVERADDRITILAGGRIRLEDLPGLAAIGVREIHVGSAVYAGGNVDPQEIRRFVDAWHDAGS